MTGLSYQKSNILWLWIQSVLYGIYIPVFGASVYILASQEQSSQANRRFMLGTAILFTIVSLETVCTFVDIFMTSDIMASTPYSGETPEIVQEKNISNFIDCFLDALNTTNIIFADGLLIWRCYMVWGRSIVVTIFPVIMLAAGSACGYTMVYLDSQFFLLRLRTAWNLPPPPEWTQLEKMYEYMSVAYYSTTLVTNLLMTSLIAFRIWRINKGLRPHLGPDHGGAYRRIVLAMVETGAIYSACLLIAVVYDARSALTATQALGVSRSVVVMISGIAPTLLIVLAGLRRTTEPSALVSTGIAFHIPPTLPVIEVTQSTESTSPTRGDGQVLSETDNDKPPTEEAKVSLRGEESDQSNVSTLVSQ
ncbi:hypothetical protein NEOLEDRAFT_1130097 [Neolentinus lepideus HHB14362 ss-1]|uniref:Fungal pheromone STE3G-protein-coupled receptor n=1 Tax=Neolentinus lepideus HHB14362 ss-1 TaxID=1314782 RepID=A0A165UGG8_9AGAM|nr:hypothetical protein NEOLEDRAFT_1130097 [Neolentinus lepideus HHB14362 ss-1]